ncbi:hypothetical protein QBC35DRAFT_250159 [Podospora australis]|uniref:Uncharacterized protein n=1 Tax=Podospora australis TaxID=1536484 RepID=A0AAN6WRM1_9PEZI|nr:hypothetical protein QBC35DRAFT_250159 [Podospora australis]
MHWRIRRLVSHSLLPFVLFFLTVGGLESVPAGADVQEDNGQVNINPDPTFNNTIPELPITAIIFSGVPGPYKCRGRIVMSVEIPPPVPAGGPTTARCYNFAHPVGCGNFVASKEAGCEAKLFAEPDCKMYLNTAVFIPEDRAVGGLWRSMEIKCGIPPPDPHSLGAPPLQGLLRGGQMGMG